MMNFFNNHLFSFIEQENVDNHHHNKNIKNIKKYNEKSFIFSDDDLKEKVIEKDKKICCVCLEKIEQKKIIMSKCRHELHVKCAKEWFHENANCPLCRSEQQRLKQRICC